MIDANDEHESKKSKIDVVDCKQVATNKNVINLKL